MENSFNCFLLCLGKGDCVNQTIEQRLTDHLAAEFVGRSRKERKGLPAIALNADTSILTAVANDYGYDAAFARQVQALGESGDVLVAISTS